MDHDQKTLSWFIVLQKHPSYPDQAICVMKKKGGKQLEFFCQYKIETDEQILKKKFVMHQRKNVFSENFWLFHFHFRARARVFQNEIE